MSFSERMGLVAKRDVLQVDAMDGALHGALWNAFFICYVHPLEQRQISLYNQFRALGIQLWLHFFKRPLDEMPADTSGITGSIRTWFFNSEWYRVYDFLEFVASHYQDQFMDGTNQDFSNFCNAMLERENSGYRFLDFRIVPIVSAEELAEVDEALTGAKSGSHRKHLASAVDLLRDHEAPDYRNSIKESISAVESVCQLVTGNGKATLGDALRWLSNKQPQMLHPALREGLVKLYGYTSDAKGIRHALTEGQVDPSFDEAKFMLVTCSAFVNLLLGAAISST